MENVRGIATGKGAMKRRMTKLHSVWNSSNLRLQQPSNPAPAAADVSSSLLFFFLFSILILIVVNSVLRKMRVHTFQVSLLSIIIHTVSGWKEARIGNVSKYEAVDLDHEISLLEKDMQLPTLLVVLIEFGMGEEKVAGNKGDEVRFKRANNLKKERKRW